MPRRADGRTAVLLGLTTAAVLLSALAATQLLLRRIPFGPLGGTNDLRIAIVHCLLLAYVPAAWFYLRARSRRTLRDLRPALSCDDARFAQMHARAGTIPPLQLTIGAAAGLAMAWLGPFLSGPGSDSPWLPADWSPEVAWHRILGPVIGIWIAWFIYSLVQESRRLSDAARLLAPIDLLDLAPLAPFTRQALTHALLTIGLLALFGLFVVDQGITPIILIMALLTLVLATGSLLLPMRGVRDRIAAAKAAELDWINRIMRTQREHLRTSPDPAAIGGLGHLASYRRLIEDVREWHFSPSAVVRMTLYLLIPLASWLASGLLGALIERSVFGN